VTIALISNVLQALGGNVLLAYDTPEPTWRGPAPGPRNYIALTNGILNVDALLAGHTEVLLPHTPLWFAPVCLPYAFDVRADCPRWRAFLARNLRDHPEKANLLQQFAGYLLLPDTSYQRFLMMLGDGANGKSVICAVLCGILGETNIASVPLEMFGDKFRLASTLGKLANIVAEVGELDRIAEGQVKSFVTGDPMGFEHKFKSPFAARPSARLVIATNNPPNFLDKSDGLWRRMLLLLFSEQIPEAERIPGMDKPEYWRDELPGIFNWAIAGLHALRTAGRFVIPAICQKDTDHLRTETNPAKRYLEHHYQAGRGEILTADAYRGYRTWSQDNGYFPLADRGFGREVHRQFPKVKRERKPTGDRPYVYQGLTKLEG
jgi:P4 family phage/plasmid primase-like protien